MTALGDLPSNDEIQTAGIENLAITTAKINDNAVTTAKIADGNVTRAKLEADAVDGTKLADNAVAREHLADNAVGTAEINDSAVTAGKLGTAAVTRTKIFLNALNSTGYVASAGSDQECVRINGVLFGMYLALANIDGDRTASKSGFQIVSPGTGTVYQSDDLASTGSDGPFTAHAIIHITSGSADVRWYGHSAATAYHDMTLFGVVG